MSSTAINAIETDAPTGLVEIGVLLRGELDSISGWVKRNSVLRTLFFVIVIVVGTGLYGAAMGCWRDPQQALYAAIKFPLIILLTALGNGLLNGMLAPLLGLNIGFRQALFSVLLTFTIFSLILGAFSPLIFFLVWNAPPMSAHVSSTYNLVLLVQVVVIAFAGITANIRLTQLLRKLSGSMRIALRVLLAWLTVNLFLGSQLSWILRPFIGNPQMPVEFLRKDVFAGNFFEAVFQTLKQLL